MSSLADWLIDALGHAPGDLSLYDDVRQSILRHDVDAASLSMTALLQASRLRLLAMMEDLGQRS